MLMALCHSIGSMHTKRTMALTYTYSVKSTNLRSSNTCHAHLKLMECKERYMLCPKQRVRQEVHWPRKKKINRSWTSTLNLMTLERESSHKSPSGDASPSLASMPLKCLFNTESIASSRSNMKALCHHSLRVSLETHLSACLEQTRVCSNCLFSRERLRDHAGWPLGTHKR